MYILFLKKTGQQMVFNLDTVEKVFIAEYVYQILRVHQSYNEVIFLGWKNVQRKIDEQADKQNKKKVPDLKDTKMCNHKLCMYCYSA